MKLEIGKCCGTCKHIHKDKPKNNLDTHAAHYMVAKTERWCHKFNIPTSREALCEAGYELENKKGGAPAVKRAQKQVNRLIAILAFKERLIKDGPQIINRYKYFVENDRVKYAYDWSGKWSEGTNISCKDNSHDDAIGFK